MADRAAVVTGASRGLGLLLARELGRKGFDLVICARSADGLEGARKELESIGVHVVAVPADVSVREEAEGVVATAVEQLGRLDVLVNNAGVIQVGPAVTMRAEQFAQALDVMLWGVVHTSLAAIPVMRDQGEGRIVTITSIGARVPAPHLLPYTTAKYAARGFSEGLRVELGKYGISVTTVVPGLMRTGSPRNALFTGNRAAEYRWFTLGASLPLLSMDAERAARRIVAGALRGRAELVLTPMAKLAAVAHGVAPGLTTRIAGVADRLLPRAEDNAAPTPGHAEEGNQPAWFRAATRLTRTAAERFHQHRDPT
ncbi:SDR family NAD(P)-dependent oxidoreductase [Amycolatopsis taiwanensis]|uniref:Ketoacyl reductase n=1 Tax=Amycolatopsis taiwanensis TaxID=342230 RepID=A0A9W6R5Q2_9PSEU|nr:SDR family oxidoreductase [Amycolatopsis taiwanensis]GLY68102.1 ketoacyl reductase [Amycolatopsis taiwanensis]